MRRHAPAAVSPLQLLQLLFVALIAAVVLFNLYSVLGRRIGRQPEEAKAGPARQVAGRANEDNLH